MYSAFLQMPPESEATLGRERSAAYSLRILGPWVSRNARATSAADTWAWTWEGEREAKIARTMRHEVKERVNMKLSGRILSGDHDSSRIGIQWRMSRKGAGGKRKA